MESLSKAKGALPGAIRATIAAIASSHAADITLLGSADDNTDTSNVLVYSYSLFDCI